MRIERFTSLEAVREIWEDLLGQADHISPFLSYEWASQWKTDLFPGGAEDSLHILVAYHEGAPVGLLPLYESPVEHWGGPTRLRQLGDLIGGEGLTEEPIALLHPDHTPETLAAMRLYLRTAPEMHRWDLVTLRWQANEYPKDKISDRLAVRPGRQTAPLPTTWADFRQSLSKTVRKNLVYYPHKLDKAGVKWEVRWADGAAEVANVSGRLVELHRARSLGERGPEHASHLATEQHASFLRNMLLGLVAKKKAALVFLVANGAIVAVQSLLFQESSTFYYYSGFDPEWYDYSPLTILSTDIIKKAVSEGSSSLEFLFDAAPWKQRWGATRSTWVVTETHYRRSLPSFARLGWNIVGRRIFRAKTPA